MKVILKEIFNKDTKLDKQTIQKIIWNITISSKDLNEQEQNIWSWYKGVSWTIRTNEMWFLAKK